MKIIGGIALVFLHASALWASSPALVHVSGEYTFEGRHEFSGSLRLLAEEPEALTYEGTLVLDADSEHPFIEKITLGLTSTHGTSSARFEFQDNGFFQFEFRTPTLLPASGGASRGTVQVSRQECIWGADGTVHCADRPAGSGA